MWEFFKQQVGLLGSIATFIFGVLSIFFFFKSLRLKRPTFIFNDMLLQTVSHPEVNILFRNRRITNLSKMNILFWNAGKEAIRKEDIPRTDAPSIEFINEAKVLSYTIKEKSRESIKFTTFKEADNLLRMEFEYLNSGDGAVIEILYEIVEPTQKFPVIFKLPIIGSLPAKTIKYQSPLSKGDIIFFLILDIFFFSLGIYMLFHSNGIGGILAGIISFLLGIGLFWINIFNEFRKRSLPKFAKTYFE